MSAFIAGAGIALALWVIFLAVVATRSRCSACTTCGHSRVAHKWWDGTPGSWYCTGRIGRTTIAPDGRRQYDALVCQCADYQRRKAGHCG